MFHVGQMVECVNPGRLYDASTRSDVPCMYINYLLKGAVYQVSWVGVYEDIDWCAYSGVQLVGVVRKHPNPFHASRFRPLQDSKLEVFRALLVNLPAPPKFAPVKEKA